MRSSVCVVAALVAACGKPSREEIPRAVPVAPPAIVASGSSAPPSPVPSATGDAVAALALVQTLTELGALHEAHQADCADLTRVLIAFHERRGRELANVSPRVQAAIDADAELAKGMRTAMDKITLASMRCRTNPEFERFRESLRTD